MAAQRIKDQFNGIATTTDATVTTLASFTLTANGTYHIFGTVVSRNTSSGVSGSTTLCFGTFKRVSATTTSVSLPAIVLAANEVGAWAVATPVAIDNSGDTIRIRVTGVAATIIDWLGDFTILMN